MNSAHLSVQRSAAPSRRRLRHPDCEKFFRLLHRRGESVVNLALKLGCGRAHLTQVLNGTRTGGRTLELLPAVLTTEELALLEQRSTWRTAHALRANAQRSTFNAAPRQVGAERSSEVLT